jgi:hypothetical protein
MHYLNIEFATAQLLSPFYFDLNSLYHHFLQLSDTRKARGKRYKLAAILVMTLLAKLAGEDEPEGIAHWLALRKSFLVQALALTRNSTPHPVTFSRVLGNAIQVEELELAIQQFFSSRLSLGKLTPVSMDGKVMCGTIPVGQTQGLHLLALYLPQHGVV